MSEVPKEIKNNLNQYIRLHLRSLFVMSEVSKVLYTYINEATAPFNVHTTNKWLPHYLI